MLKEIGKIIVISVNTALLVVVGMIYFVPKPQIPEIPKFEMPKCEEMFANFKAPVIPTGPPAGISMGIPKDVLALMPTPKTAEDMKKSSADMKKSVKDMKMWAGKMQDASNEMEIIRDQMKAACSAKPSFVK